MTTYTLQWGKHHEAQQRTLVVEAPAPSPDQAPHQYDALARVILDRLGHRVGRPWLRPVEVTVAEAYGVREGVTQGCGYFAVYGRTAITGTWWETNLGDPE